MNFRAMTDRLVALVPQPVRRLIGVCVDRRLPGLSAECAFWITFTLPWIALGVLSSIGLIASRIDPAAVAQVQATVLEAASRVLTPQAANSFLKPIIDQLGTGRVDLTVIGVVIALWSGSRMVSSLTEGVAVIHGEPRHHGYARNRGIGLLIYVVALVGAAIAVAVMALGPDRMVPAMGMSSGGQFVSYFLAGACVFGLLVLLYQAAAPDRAPLRLDLLGAAVGLVGWIAGSAGLHLYTDRLFSDFSVYAAVAAPIAVLLWSYVTALAVLIGSAVGVALDTRTPAPTWPLEPMRTHHQSRRGHDSAV